MTQTFLKTLKKDYVERMIIAAPNNFSEMVTMGTRLEEAVRMESLCLRKLNLLRVHRRVQCSDEIMCSILIKQD
ncbi:RPE15 protein, putative [Medicago truncatula]|uniref:RPE15 protein, putative n=1 Tax=Medicago truncatula TaxID=3880 RepID=A0A072U0G3_MEDTR|nr:RPE15 protein, putative [Medicago truncatula]